MSTRTVLGSLLLLVGTMFVFGIMLAEFAYPGYNVSTNYISDLGVWSQPSAIIFNSMLILTGCLILVCAYLVQLLFKSRAFTTLVVLNGIGAIGVGIFNEEAGSIHTFFSLVTFLFGGLAAIATSRFTKRPFSLISPVLGIVSLTALFLIALDVDLGLGIGGMERMIAYPEAVWVICFGGYLLGSAED
jgi:hypothetical membrane protein